MEKLHMSGADLAGYAGVDRTNISRFKNGSRTCRPGSRMAIQLVNAIYYYADEHNLSDRLLQILKMDAPSSADEIKVALSNWLFFDPSASVRRTAQDLRQSNHTFGDRLDKVMSLTGLSNSRLSRMLNVDASLISRYRTGVRTPKANREMIPRLGSLLWQNVQSSGSLSTLSLIMDFPEESIDEQYFCNWLFDFDAFNDMGSAAAERLLDVFNSYTAGSRLPVPAIPDTVISSVLSDKREQYQSDTGLQEAVIRFLASALKVQAKELWLYSDQNTDWLFGDPSFTVKWAVLMQECVRSGIRIRIIHNLNRDLNEMIDAIGGWLPLYMSGMIEPFYCREPESKRFTHTIFLCPHQACIEGCHVLGTEKDGIYLYHTDKQRLENARKAFEKLMESADPLITFSMPSPFNAITAGLNIMQNTLSEWTRPESLAKELLSPEAFTTWKQQQTAIRDVLHNGRINEFIPLNEKNTQYDSPAHLKAHIQNILDLMDAFPGYRLYILPESPFPNIRILCGKTFVSISHSLQPALSFTITHPLMCAAFSAYIDNIAAECRMDKITLKQELMKIMTLTENG